MVLTTRSQPPSSPTFDPLKVLRANVVTLFDIPLAGSRLAAVPGERKWRWQSATALAGRYPDELVRKWVNLLCHNGRIEVCAAASLALETEKCLQRLAKRQT